MKLTCHQRVVVYLVAFKVLYILTLTYALGTWGNLDFGQYWQVERRWPSGGDPTFSSHFGTWDAAHYLYLSTAGYAKDVRSCAFYPLWPLLVRWTAHLAGGSHLIAGLVLSNLFSLAAWVLFYERVRRRWGTSVASWAQGFLIVFPGSLFFQFLYSESLFFLLVMMLWWGLEERRWGLAWVAALLLPLTRAVGVFAVLPIGWQALQVAPPGWFIWLKAWGARQWGKLGVRSHELEVRSQERKRRLGSAGASPYRGTGGSTESRPTGTGVQRRWRMEDLRKPWALLAAPVIGWGCYLTLMWHWTGNPFEGFAAQKHWGVHSVWNLVNVPKFIMGIFQATEGHEFIGSLLDRCVGIGLICCLPLAWRLDKGLLIWMYWLGILPAMSGTFTSLTRYVSCVFPMFIALAAWVRRPELHWLRWELLIAGAVLHIILVWRFVNFRWAG